MIAARVNEKCIGCGLCTSLAASVFRMTDQGTAEAKPQIEPGEEDAVKEAAESCPADAIDLRRA